MKGNIWISILSESLSEVFASTAPQPIDRGEGSKRQGFQLLATVAEPTFFKHMIGQQENIATSRQLRARLRNLCDGASIFLIHELSGRKVREIDAVPSSLSSSLRLTTIDAGNIMRWPEVCLVRELTFPTLDLSRIKEGFEQKKNPLGISQ